MGIPLLIINIILFYRATKAFDKKEIIASDNQLKGAFFFVTATLLSINTWSVFMDNSTGKIIALVAGTICFAGLAYLNINMLKGFRFNTKHKIYIWLATLPVLIGVLYLMRTLIS